MKHPRLSVAMSAPVLFACLSLAAFCPQAAAAPPPVHGATYITTNTDSTGTFSSRSVITLHPDHTLSVIDSGQGGPFYFTSQLGVWGIDDKGTLVGRTIDFDYPPNADVARLDYSFQFGANGSISGTIALRTFVPIATANPLDGGGTLLGTFTFTGYIVTLH